jgi:hypothetical protein
VPLDDAAQRVMSNKKAKKCCKKHKEGKRCKDCPKKPD